MDFLKRIREHRFELQHFIILFIILVIFQFALTYLNKYSSNSLISKTMDLYKKDSAEKIANLSTTSLELLLENHLNKEYTENNQEDIVEAFNIIFSQQMLQENINEICILISKNNKVYVIDDGKNLYSYFFMREIPGEPNFKHIKAVEKFKNIKDNIQKSEKIISILGDDNSFYNYVPLVLRGEYHGAVYVKITPNLSLISENISSSYNQISIVFTSLILFGLLAMFYITSFTVEERDETKNMLFVEKERQIKREIEYSKESLFTKRIYHVHHKAEKIMGFIKEEIRGLSNDNIQKFKYKVSKYANFVSRVIYDMKWYDAPIHATRSPMFNSNINEIITFLVENVFNRVYGADSGYSFELDLDENMKSISINEYVIWEVLEPLIQNSIEHNENEILIKISTKYNPDNQSGKIVIQDNGNGIPPELLETDDDNIKKLFREHYSTKTDDISSGYGCYIAYEIANRKLGWDLSIENIETKGCRFILNIPKM